MKVDISTALWLCHRGLSPWQPHGTGGWPNTVGSQSRWATWHQGTSRKRWRWSSSGGFDHRTSTKEPTTQFSSVIHSLADLGVEPVLGFPPAVQIHQHWDRWMFGDGFAVSVCRQSVTGRTLPKLDADLQKQWTAAAAGGRASPQLSGGLLDLDYLCWQNYPLEETAARRDSPGLVHPNAFACQRDVTEALKPQKCPKTQKMNKQRMKAGCAQELHTWMRGERAVVGEGRWGYF